MPRYSPADPNLPDVGDRVVITDELYPDDSNGDVLGMGWLPDGEPGYSVEVLDAQGALMGIVVFARAHQLRKVTQ